MSEIVTVYRMFVHVTVDRELVNKFTQFKRPFCVIVDACYNL